jgi:hypothetical protein
MKVGVVNEVRNNDIIADAEYVVAFWDGKSKGKNILETCVQASLNLSFFFHGRPFKHARGMEKKI